MSRSGACVVVGLAVLAVLVGLLPSVGAVTYTFTKIADTQGEFARFGTLPSIKDNGIVAFQAELKAGGQGIFAGSGGPLTTIAPAGVGSPLGAPSINTSGTVVFLGGSLATPAGFAGVGILTGSGGPVTIVVHNALPPYGGFADPVINDAGTLAFVAQLKTGPLEVLRGSAPPFTLIADNRGAFDGFVSNRVAINQWGEVAFFATFKLGGAGVFVGEGYSLTTIADTSGILSSVEEWPSLNDFGTVAFIATLDVEGKGIFIGSGGPLTKLVDTDGTEFDNFTAPVINNAGMVAFRAQRPGEGTSIFTGPDSTADRVIGSGDPLFSSTVLHIEGRIAMNDNGQIAFVATLTDGTAGVFRADPIPELSDSDGDSNARSQGRHPC